MKKYFRDNDITIDQRYGTCDNRIVKWCAANNLIISRIQLETATLNLPHHLKLEDKALVYPPIPHSPQLITLPSDTTPPVIDLATCDEDARIEDDVPLEPDDDSLFRWCEQLLTESPSVANPVPSWDPLTPGISEWFNSQSPTLEPPPLQPTSSGKIYSPLGVELQHSTQTSPSKSDGPKSTTQPWDSPSPPLLF